MSVDSCSQCACQVDSDWDSECYDTGKCLCAYCQDSVREVNFKANSLNSLLKRELGDLYGEIVTRGESHV